MIQAGTVNENGAAEAALLEETGNSSDVFLTEITIKHVRHLHDIVIPLSKTERKNLILTGENGSGKSSVLTALRECLDLEQGIVFDIPQMDYHRKRLPKNLKTEVKWSVPQEVVRNSSFVTAELHDNREIGAYKDVNPALDLPSSLLRLAEMLEECSEEGDEALKEELNGFFLRFQRLLQTLYDDKTLKLRYHPETKRENARFSIHVKGREAFDFDTLARGYSAVLELIGQLICLSIMGNQEGENEGESENLWDFRRPCVALIDEVDAHLHVSLQKKILPILTELFPKIQFIVTTHSPFVLASAKNAVVYDLEHRTLAADGLSNVPYSGIVEGYFRVDEMSDKLEANLDAYRALAGKKEWTDADYAEAARLELELDKVPDFLAAGWKAEYSRLKLEIAADKGE